MSFRLGNNAFSTLAKTPDFAGSVNNSQAKTDKSTETFTVTLKSAKNLDAQEITDKILKQIGYLEQDVQAYKKKYGEDPRKDILKHVQQSLSDPSKIERGITNKVEVYGVPKLETHRLRAINSSSRNRSRSAEFADAKQTRIAQN